MHFVEQSECFFQSHYLVELFRANFIPRVAHLLEGDLTRMTVPTSFRRMSVPPLALLVLALGALCGVVLVGKSGNPASRSTGLLGVRQDVGFRYLTHTDAPACSPCAPLCQLLIFHFGAVPCFA